LLRERTCDIIAEPLRGESPEWLGKHGFEGIG